MGYDLIAIANHRLNTSSLASTAADLAARFSVEVRYGYIIQRSEAIDLETVIEGIYNEGANDKYMLSCGDVYFKNGVDERGDSWDKIDWEFYRLDNWEDTRCNIKRETIELKVPWALRWWSFCKIFTGEFPYERGLETLREYRLNAQQMASAVGGEACVYCADQGETQQLLYQPIDSTWEDLLMATKRIAGDKFVNVGAWLAEHLKTGQALCDYPLAFYDDFSNLELSLPAK